jgi:hypothetical protein
MAGPPLCLAMTDMPTIRPFGGADKRGVTVSPVGIDTDGDGRSQG